MLLERIYPLWNMELGLPSFSLELQGDMAHSEPLILNF